MPSTSNRQASIDSRRIALEREVTIRVPRFDTFVTEYSTNISTTGMFIVSGKPHAPGTTFTFEFSVADDWKLIRGKAQVVWTRYRDEDKARPAGMGVRFVELDAQSRRLIRWIVEKHIREGGKPFELDELRNVIDEALEDVIDSSEPVELAATAPKTLSAPRNRPTARRPAVTETRSSQRHIFPLVITAAAIVLGLVGLFWLTEWLPERSAAAAAADTTASAQGITEIPEETGNRDGGPGGPNQTASGVTGGSNRSQASSSRVPEGGVGASDSSPDAGTGTVREPRSVGVPPLGSAYGGVRDVLTTWSGAWSAKDVEGYLAAYSSEFKPAGLSRSAWEAQRRERLTAPKFIKVSISQLDIVRVRDNLVEATFFQSYRSDRFSDSVEKVFELVWEDGSWRILSERAR